MLVFLHAVPWFHEQFGMCPDGIAFQPAMTTLAAIYCLSFLLCVAITPALRVIARRCELVDRPDGNCKVHSESVPVAGGIAVFLSVVVALGATLVIPNAMLGELNEQARFLWTLLVAAGAICLVGLADDRWGLRARYKLLGQIVAVALIVAGGLTVRTIRLFHWELDLGLLAVPFTAFWLLGAINSLNLLDGMDGLLSSVGAVISLAMAAMAVMGQHWAAACVAVALAGALLGFLCFNFPPATVFLGESGSMLIGLIIGMLGIHSSLKGPATIALTAPVVALTIPIFDTLAAIIRRKLLGRSVSSGDRDHLHHCLLRRGFSNRAVLSFVSIGAFATGAGALASLALNNEAFAALSAIGVVVTFVATRIFGYVEFQLMKDRLISCGAALLGRTRRDVSTHIVQPAIPQPVTQPNVTSVSCEASDAAGLPVGLADLATESESSTWAVGSN
jgi:UDP-GlcNAc:undecaprenyl-phosphate GlcNAc-1-phosphate transferase